MNNLTAFELELVRTVLNEQKDEHPKLVAQIPFLLVRSRKLTGVGQYVYFELTVGGQGFIDHDYDNGICTVNKMVDTDNPVSGLGFALDITHGCVNFLELFTYGDEQWDGNIGRYKVIDI